MSDFALDGTARRDGFHDLDCIVCGRWFPTFDRLARHMTAKHGAPTPNRPGDVELPPATGRQGTGLFGAKRMPPKKKTAKALRLGSATNSGRIPPPEESQSKQSSEFNAFIKAEDLGKVGATAVLVFTGECRLADSGFGEQLIAEVKLGRDHFDWGITLNTPNHRMLYEKFGDNSKRWRNKKIGVVVKMSRQNRPYIAVARS